MDYLDIIKRIEAGEADNAIMDFMKAQFEAHHHGRSILKFTPGKGFWYMYDEADQRAGDPKKTGEDSNVYAVAATRDYDALPKEFDFYPDEARGKIDNVSWDWRADENGYLERNGWSTAIDKNETVTEARENFITNAIDRDFNDFKERIIESLKQC